MTPELIAYPFLFLAIFFESFVLVTLLSHPARAARRRTGKETPSVAVIVPCYNEAQTIAKTCQSILALEYPKEKLEVVLVDDGSTDGTREAMQQFASHPQVKIIYKENGGKHTALNAGIAATDAKLIGCLDADSFVEPDALREIIPCFTRGLVGAVTGAMSVDRPTTILQHIQNVEYIFGITFRHAIASVNGLYVTPGPFSFYRRSVLAKLGGFRHGHQTEDMEMALRIQQAGYAIENAPKARVYTKAPPTVWGLVRQRTRWTSGFLRNIFGEYRGLIGSSKHGTLGLLILPTAVTAIISGILLFGLVLIQTMSHLLTALEIRAGIPLSYSLTPHTAFDWFFIPTNLYLSLAAVAVAISFVLVFVGKRISKTPGNLTLGILFYLCYGLIVPLWLIRATSDVLLGTQRSWK
jgi:cellulose synthase/poly-beta-1,6-N-acetylglucosamine synthase-like glycosyltransferase